MKRKVVGLGREPISSPAGVALSSSPLSTPDSPPSPRLPVPTLPLPPLLRRPPTAFPSTPYQCIPQPPTSIFLSSHYRALGLLRPSLLSSTLSKTPPQYQLSATRLLHSMHTASLTSLVLESIESRFLLSADAHGLIALYDTQPPLTPSSTATPVQPLSTSAVTTGRGGHYAVNGLCWYAVDTGMFISGGTDGRVHSWDTNAFAISHSFSLRDASVNAVAMSAVSVAHSLIGVASTDSNVRLCDLKSGGFAHTLIGHAAEVTTIAWTPFSEFLLVTGSVDKTVRMWDIRRSGCLAIFDQYNSASSTSLTARYTSTTPWTTHSSRELSSHSASVSHVHFTPVSSLLLSLGTDSRLRLWNPFTCTNTLTHFSHVVNRYRYARFDVSAGVGGRERVWLGSGKDVREVGVREGGMGRRLVGHFDRVTVVCVNDRWDEAYSGGVDHSMLVWGRRKEEGTDEKEEGELVEREGAELGDEDGEGGAGGADQDEWSDDER